MTNYKSQFYWTMLVGCVFLAFTLGRLAWAMGALDYTYPYEGYTPGVADPAATVKKLCTPGYTAKVRNVSQAVKNAVMREYNLPLSKSSGYEIDHFISLENGGSNDIKNLWAEYYCPVGNDPMKTNCWGAREKDKVETALHRWLCAGKITLPQDQKILMTDWVACYKLMAAGKVCQ